MHTARTWSVTQLSNEVLDREYAARVGNDRASTAELLMYLGEMEARKRYIPAGYPSMFRFCVEHGRMSEDVAYKRIRTARMARRFPEIYDRIADGRLTISALVLLAPEMTEHTAARLLSDAEYKTNEQVKRLLAAVAPKPDVPTKEREVPSPSASVAASIESRDVSTSSAELAVRPVAPSQSNESSESMGPLWSTTADADGAHYRSGASEAPEAPETPQAPHATVPRGAPQAKRTQHTPLSPTSMHVSATLSMQVYEQLQEARELLSHRLASRELSEVLESLLAIALPVLRKQKFAEASRPRAPRSKDRPINENDSAASPSQARQIPAHVKREVWERDGGRCTFVGTDGHRCTCRERIEFDHRVPVAKGGASTVENVRLLCRAHNQYEAERLLGERFMRGKRAWASGKIHPRRTPIHGQRDKSVATSSTTAAP
ncbi:MAG: HNH endonuclease [Candidatus Eisenbacteria bacterium]|uniref:HNH endonuclease n=1 Tax=Eiseniibacteriota bacterium TaxID=2212470 RepID=A0A933SD46_UNCEI|nr:HNH endonuclease [Candidatus Eisenbacteria bacterium]